MERWFVTPIAILAMLVGFYLSAQHFAEPVATAPGPMQPGPVSNDRLVGNMRPDFELANHHGELVSSDDFSGKAVLLNFWATWCSPCREEMPMLMDLQRDNASKGFQVVGIALDDTQAVKRFVQSYGIDYPILVGEADVFNTSAAYGNQEGVLPFSVLIDKKGIIRWQYAGLLKPDELNRQLNKIF